LPDEQDGMHFGKTFDDAMLSEILWNVLQTPRTLGYLCGGGSVFERVLVSFEIGFA
jgi:hypothetical protein